MSSDDMNSLQARIGALQTRINDQLNRARGDGEEEEEDVAINETGATQGEVVEDVNSEPGISQRYNEDDADMTLMSSDGVKFKVHSVILLRASIQSMVDIAQSSSQRDPITLPDQYVDHSQVIKASLDIVYDREINSFSDNKLYHHVIEFARKYDMPVILKTISKELRLHSNDPGTNKLIPRMFRLAIDLGDNEAITAIVKSRAGKSWGTSSPSTLIDNPFLPSTTLSLPGPTIVDAHSHYLEGAPVFELGGWPYARFAELPLPLIWAVLRAGQVVDRSHRSRRDTLGSELKKVLGLMYPKTSGSSGEGSAAPPP